MTYRPKQIYFEKKADYDQIDATETVRLIVVMAVIVLAGWLIARILLWGRRKKFEINAKYRQKMQEKHEKTQKFGKKDE